MDEIVEQPSSVAQCKVCSADLPLTKERRTICPTCLGLLNGNARMGWSG